jgi:TPR repeat protein
VAHLRSRHLAAEKVYWYDKAAAQGHAQAAYFAKYLRDNHGMDGSSRDDDERAMLGPLLGRTVPFIAPFGTTFHHLSERLAFVRGEYVNQENAKAMANYQMRSRAYKECRDAGRDSCLPPGPPPR